MLWSNSITFSINSFSFGLGITAFFPFYQLEKTNTIEFFFFFFFLCLRLSLMYSFVKIQKITLFVWWGQDGFAFFHGHGFLHRYFLIQNLDFDFHERKSSMIFWATVRLIIDNTDFLFWKIEFIRKEIEKKLKSILFRTEWNYYIHSCMLIG